MIRIELNEFIDNIGEGLVAYFVDNEDKAKMITDGNDFPEITVTVPYEPKGDAGGEFFIGLYDTNNGQIFVTNTAIKDGEKIFA